MLSIGAFSKISKVSANALRYYDEIGLIKPAMVNHDNGYRYYSTEQLRTILMISKLKSYQLSLEEISEVMQKPEDDRLLLSLIQQKRRDTYQKLHQLNAVMQRMDQDIMNLERGISIMSYLDQIEVQLKETEPKNILYIRKIMSTKDFGLYYSQLLETIEREKLTIIGAPINIFHLEEEFDPDSYDNEIAIPVKETVSGTRVLPGGLCAMVVLKGPYTELPSVYAKLQQWVGKEKYTPAGDAYEVYISDPHTTAPKDNVTEVYLPIKR